MSTEPAPPGPPTGQTPAPPRAKRRRVVWASASAFVLVMLIAVGLGAAQMLTRTTVEAPDWAQARLADALNDASGESEMSFDALRVGLTRDLRPRVQMQNVLVENGTGERELAITSLQATLSGNALMRGSFEVQELDVSGLSLAVTRVASQEWDIAFGPEPGSDPAPSDIVDPSPIGSILADLDRRLQGDALKSLVRANADNVHIAYRDLYAKQSWSVDGSQIQMTQGPDALSIRADVALLTGRGELATVVFDIDQDRVTDVATLAAQVDGVAARDLATQSPALAWMQVLDAPISGAFRLDATETSVGRLYATLSIGAGTVKPEGQARPIAFGGAQTYFSFDAARTLLNFDLVEIDSALGSVTATGVADLQPSATGLLGETIVAQMAFDRLELAPSLMAGFGERGFSGATADLKITLDPFAIDIGQAVVPVEGRHVMTTGRIEGQPTGWDVALNLGVDEISFDEVMALWPESARPKARTWFVENFQSGTATDVKVALRDGPERGRQFGGTFAFSDLGLRFLRHLPSLEAGRGVGTLSGAELALQLEEGTILPAEGGRLDGTGTTMVFKDLTAKPVQARLDLDVSGALTAMLSTIDNRPFEFLTKADRPVTLGDGQARLKGEITFPLRKRVELSEVGVDLRGEVAGFRSDQIVPDRTLTSALARVDITKDALVVSGPMQVSDVDVNGTWTMPLAPDTRGGSKFVGDVELSPRALDVFEIALPPGSVAGRGSGRLELDLNEGQAPQFRLTSNLRGAAINIAALDWGKPAGAEAELLVAGEFGTAPVVDDLRLSGAGLSLEGRLSANDGGLGDLELERLAVGDWLNAGVTLVGQGPGVPARIEVRGGTLDLRRLPQGDPGGSDSQNVLLELDRLQVSDTIALTDFRGQMRIGSSMAGDFTARVNGDAPISGVLIPGEDGARIQVASNDGGAVMRAAGILPNAEGGNLVLNLTPTGQDGVLNGTLRVTDTRLRDAPAMASLLSAVSVVGLIEQLAGQGLVFTEVDAEFQLTPQDVRVFKSSAVGPSLGLSLDGTYRLGDRTMDMQGVVSPLYLLNGIGSIFTRKGEGLLGFNFTMRGPAAAPAIGVNPFSILTPGMFREIFRRPPPEPTN